MFFKLLEKLMNNYARTTNYSQTTGMNKDEENRFWEQFKKDHANAGALAAKARDEAGLPMYYSDDAYPGKVLRKWPDGKKEVVEIDEKRGAIISSTPI